MKINWDAALLVAATQNWSAAPFALIGLSYLTKLGGCVLGGRRS